MRLIEAGLSRAVQLYSLQDQKESRSTFLPNGLLWRLVGATVQSLNRPNKTFNHSWPHSSSRRSPMSSARPESGGSPPESGADAANQGAALRSLWAHLGSLSLFLRRPTPAAPGPPGGAWRVPPYARVIVLLVCSCGRYAPALRSVRTSCSVSRSFAGWSARTDCTAAVPAACPIIEAAG